MSVPLTEEHTALASTVESFARDHDLLGLARAGLETKSAGLPTFWPALGAMGWLGLHLPTEVGGSGYGLLEAVVVAEQLGRVVAPGPYVATVVVSALLDRLGPADARSAILPDLADATSSAGFSLDSQLRISDGLAYGDGGLALNAPQVRWVAIAADEDVVLVDTMTDSTTVTAEDGIDPSRPVGRVLCDGAPVIVLPGARATLITLARVLMAAEAVGVAGACLDRAVAYAKVREQFGRTIGSFQAIKHHCANMYVEVQLAAAAVWTAGRDLPAAEQGLAAAMAASIAVPAAKLNADLNIRIHGGIGFTWEENGHLFLRRALALIAFCDPERAAADVTTATLDGVRINSDADLSAADNGLTQEVITFLDGIRTESDPQQMRRIVQAGYAVPHWPPPWGRSAGAVERLAIRQGFEAAGVAPPAYGITGWILFALIRHGRPEQIERWVLAGLYGEQVWCQLFSEPEAGSDAAAVKTSATRVEGGWRLRGHKLWTTLAHKAQWGLATVRTDPNGPKHAGISTMAVDMSAAGVTVRPLRQINGDEEFNEVYLEDVFVPDDSVLGAIGDGWSVARTTLAAESSSIGAGATSITVPIELLLDLWRERPDRLAGGEVRIGRYLSRVAAVAGLNRRATFRELAGHQPGAEGSIPKLVLADNTHEGSEILLQLAGADAAVDSAIGGAANALALRVLALAIAGGTSEIKRNQIAERVLGLPRESTSKG